MSLNCSLAFSRFICIEIILEPDLSFLKDRENLRISLLIYDLKFLAPLHIFSLLENIQEPSSRIVLMRFDNYLCQNSIHQLFLLTHLFFF
jgi:hypothetical protein